jgi:hypothetical protein
MLNLLMKGLKVITNLPQVRVPAITHKANDPFHTKKVSAAVHPFHLGGAQRLVTWLKSRENKALMSP